MIHGIMVKQVDIEIIEKLNDSIFKSALSVHEIDGFTYLFLDDINLDINRDDCLDILYHLSKVVQCMVKKNKNDEKLPSLSSILDV